MRFKAIIFDMDGVLVESEMLSAEATMRTLQKYGISFDRTRLLKELNKLKGMRFIDVLKKLAAVHGWNINLAEFSKTRHQEYEKLAVRLRQRDNASKIIRRLKNKGYKLAVASSGTSEKLKANLKNSGLGSVIKRYVDVIVSGDMVKKSKPEPEIFLKAADALGVKPVECCVIEDTLLGIHAAKRAGMTVIAITGTFPRQKLSSADYVIDSLMELDRML